MLLRTPRWVRPLVSNNGSLNSLNNLKIPRNALKQLTSALHLLTTEALHAALCPGHALL